MTRKQKQRENRAIEALIALALRPAPLTDAELDGLKICGPVQLSKEDKAALDRAKPKLFAEIRRILKAHHDNQQDER